MNNKKNSVYNLSSMKKWIILISIALLVVAAYALSANKQTNKSEVKTESSSIRLKWINQAQFAGYYMAAKNGHFKDAGLKVRIDPAGPNISPTQMVTSGVNEFGIAGADEILQARSKGVPVVALAVIFQENPEALTSFKSKNITKPSDLIGKRVGVIYGNDENLYRDFLLRNKVDSSQITEVAAVPGGSQLLSDQVDVVMAYSMNVPVLLKLQGIETNVMKFSDFGVKFHGDTLFTTEKMINENPDKVRGFVKATLAGWQDAIRDPEAATSEVMKINPALKSEAQLGYLKGVIPLLEKDGKIGSSDVNTWNSMQDTLFNLGVITKKIDVKEAYTNKFIPE